MNPYHPAHTPDSQGTLHRWDNETANCGMGAIAHLKGERSYQIIDYALTSVCNMTHRGAVDADGKTGDGSGVLCQIPYPLFKKEVEKLGHTLENDSDLAVGVFFLPGNDDAAGAQIKSFTESVVTRRGIELFGWREVPVHPDALGEIALKTQPVIFHLLLKKPADWASDHYERQLYLCRREIEREFDEVENFYMPTFSSKLISYKGLAMPAALREFYDDLQNSDFQTGISLYHQRFSTNTFPAWPLGQPFRNMCHNGEINTVRGNRNWMASREEFFESDIWGEDVELLKDLLSFDRESDSSSLDHALELLVLSGRSLEHAMCMLVPPAFRTIPTSRASSAPSTNTCAPSRSPGTARPASSTPTASRSAPRSTATACAPPASPSPRTACSTSGPSPAPSSCPATPRSCAAAASARAR